MPAEDHHRYLPPPPVFAPRASSPAAAAAPAPIQALSPRPPPTRPYFSVAGYAALFFLQHRAPASPALPFQKMKRSPGERPTPEALRVHGNIPPGSFPLPLSFQPASIFPAAWLFFPA